MSIEDPRPGDRFRVVFEGTYTGVGLLSVGPGADGFSWLTITEYAVSVEPIAPEVTPGLYMDSDDRPWKAVEVDGTIWLTPLLVGARVSADQAHTIPGLRRARLIPVEDDNA